MYFSRIRGTSAPFSSGSARSISSNSAATSFDTKPDIKVRIFSRWRSQDTNTSVQHKWIDLVLHCSRLQICVPVEPLSSDYQRRAASRLPKVVVQDVPSVRNQSDSIRSEAGSCRRVLLAKIVRRTLSIILESERRNAVVDPLELLISIRWRLR
jgi:hypothetical protein